MRSRTPSDQLQRIGMPVARRPARRFRFVPAPHSCLGASLTGLSPSRLLTSALRWTCQSSAVVQSGRASGEQARQCRCDRSCAGSTSRASTRRWSEPQAPFPLRLPRSGARRLPRGRRVHPLYAFGQAAGQIANDDVFDVRIGCGTDAQQFTGQQALTVVHGKSQRANGGLFGERADRAAVGQHRDKISAVVAC